MKTSTFLSSVLLALGVSASPVVKRAPTSSASTSATASGSILSSPTISSSAAASTPTGSSSNATTTPAAGALNDTQILQFALTLEHLENAFYNASISLLSDEDFQNAGYNTTTRDQLYSIGQDEQAHVQFLTAALGNNSVSPCEYDLSSVTDVKSFLATAQVLEGVGVSAYLGAAKLILDKTYLEAAGSILTVESRHQSYINSQVNSTGNAIPAAFDTPLNATEVYSLAAPFIKSCPQNSTLPFKAFPAATISLASSSASNATSGSNSTQTTNSTTPEVNASNSTGSANSTSASITPGSQVAITYEKTMAQSQDGNNASTVYVAIISGPTAPTFVELPESGIITLPANITGGQFYAVVTSSNETVSDDTALAIGAGQVLVPLPKAPAATASQSASSSSATASETSTDAASSASSGIGEVPSSGASSATSSLASASVTSGVSASATSGVASLSSSVVPTSSA